MGLKDLLGGKKKETYFLEFSDAASTPTAPAKVEPAKVEAPKAPKAEAPKAKAAKAEAPKASAPAPVAPVAPAIAPPTPKPAPVLTTFAPEYLTPTLGASRRRPGPSLTMFKDMARSMGR